MPEFIFKRIVNEIGYGEYLLVDGQPEIYSNSGKVYAYFFFPCNEKITLAIGTWLGNSFSDGLSFDPFLLRFYLVDKYIENHRIG